MPLNKRLAQATEKAAGTVPYIDQKSVKQILVGVEKLCKAFEEQILNSKGLTVDELSFRANATRSLCGLTEDPCILTLEEIIHHDYHIREMLSRDVSRILNYIRQEEHKLEMEVIKMVHLKRSSGSLIPFVEHSEKLEPIGLLLGYMTTFAAYEDQVDFKDRLNSLKEYIEINVGIFNQLLKRRSKICLLPPMLFEDHHKLTERSILPWVLSFASYVQDT